MQTSLIHRRGSTKEQFLIPKPEKITPWKQEKSFKNFIYLYSTMNKSEKWCYIDSWFTSCFWYNCVRTLCLTISHLNKYICCTNYTIRRGIFKTHAYVTARLRDHVHIKIYQGLCLNNQSWPRRCPLPQPPQPPPPPPLSWSRGLRLAGGTPKPLTPPWRFGRSL